MSRFAGVKGKGREARALTAHVEACSRCVVVGCAPRTLCPTGTQLWNKWALGVGR